MSPAQWSPTRKIQALRQMALGTDEGHRSLDVVREAAMVGALSLGMPIDALHHDAIAQR